MRSVEKAVCDGIRNNRPKRRRLNPPPAGYVGPDGTGCATGTTSPRVLFCPFCGHPARVPEERSQ